MDSNTSTLEISNKVKLVLTFFLTVLIVLVPLFLVFLNTSPVATVAYALENPGEEISLESKYVPNSYVISPDGTLAHFEVFDLSVCDGSEDEVECKATLRYGEGMDTLKVAYSGEIGNLFFNDHSVFNMLGVVNKDNVFEVTTLSVKCPTKYQTESERNDLYEVSSY